MAQFRQDLETWTLDLFDYAPNGRVMRLTLGDLVNNMRMQKVHRSAAAVSELSPDLYKQLISCHAATSEFLQQFWQAALPSVNPNSSLTLAQRVTKARRLQEVLGNTYARIARIATAAEEERPGTGKASVDEVRSGVGLLTQAFTALRAAVARARAYGHS